MIRQALGHMSPFVHSSVMLRSAVLEELGGYRLQFRAASDYDLFLRIADRHELANIPEFVVRYRVHPSMMTVHRIEEQSLYAVAARSSSRARIAGQPDPLAATDHIDRATLRELVRLARGAGSLYHNYRSTARQGIEHEGVPPA